MTDLATGAAGATRPLLHDPAASPDVLPIPTIEGPMAQEPAPAASLQAMIREWVERHLGEPVVKLQLHVTCANGATLRLAPRRRAMDMPAGGAGRAGDNSGLPAWTFTELRATYRGRAFRVRGMRLKLLQALAVRAGDEVPNADLKAAVWGDNHAADDSQLRNLVCQLRGLLVRELGAGGDCVLACLGAHKLTLT